MLHDIDQVAAHGHYPAASPFDKCISEILRVSAFELRKVEFPALCRTIIFTAGWRMWTRLLGGGSRLASSRWRIDSDYCGHLIAITR